MKKTIIIIVVFILMVFCSLTGCSHTHVWNDATCTSPKKCIECEETEGESLGHDWKSATCSLPKTCARCGTTEGQKLGHEWEEATCLKAKTCSRCGKTEGNPLGHDAPGLSCTESAICVRCKSEIPALGHEWKNATCTEPKKCSRCGITEGDALGHSSDSPKKENETASTCTKEGHYEEVVYCSACKTELSRKSVTEAALGHQIKDGVCTRCGEKITVTLYEDTTIKITFKNAEKDAYSNDEVELYFFVENKTNNTLLIQADAISINGFCFCDLVMSDYVSPLSTGKVNVSVENFDFDVVDISRIDSVGAQFRIIDQSTNNRYKATFSNVKLDGSGKGDIPSDFTNNNLLYEDNTCSIYHKKMAKYKYSDDEVYLYLFLKNKSAATKLIQADAISVNGYGYSSLVMSDYVLPNTIGIISVKIEKFDFDIVDINNVKNIGGQLRIIDDSMDSRYKATFSNVSIK